MNDLAAFVASVLDQVEIVEAFAQSCLCGQRLTLENVEMYSVCTYFVKPLTQPHTCSLFLRLDCLEV